MKVVNFILLIIESFFSLTCYQTWITTTQAGAQMFAATNALKKPVTSTTFSIILKLLVHLLQMGAAHAQKIKWGADKVRCYFLIAGNESCELHFTYHWILLSLTDNQTLITTTLAGAQMFAATNRLKKPVPTTELRVHLLPMVVAHAQKIKWSANKVRCYFLVVLNEGYTLHFTYIWILLSLTDNQILVTTTLFSTALMFALLLMLLHL